MSSNVAPPLLMCAIPQLFSFLVGLVASISLKIKLLVGDLRKFLSLAEMNMFYFRLVGFKGHLSLVGIHC